VVVTVGLTDTEAPLTGILVIGPLVESMLIPVAPVTVQLIVVLWPLEIVCGKAVKPPMAGGCVKAPAAPPDTQPVSSNRGMTMAAVLPKIVRE
jgi:hypothetical protein